MKLNIKQDMDQIYEILMNKASFFMERLALFNLMTDYFLYLLLLINMNTQLNTLFSLVNIRVKSRQCHPIVRTSHHTVIKYRVVKLNRSVQEEYHHKMSCFLDKASSALLISSS